MRVDQLADRRREGHQRRGEDHRDDAGHVDAQRQVGLPARGHPPPDDALGVLDRDPALALLDEDDGGDDGEHEERQHDLEDLVVGRVPGLRALGRRETMMAKIISEMPLPMPRWVISSPIHITSTVPAVSDITIRKMCWRSKMRDDRVCSPCRASGTGRRSRSTGAKAEADGEVARVLRDPGLPDLALLRELLERRHDDLQQLQDDRGRDVGHDPQREDRELPQRAAREQVEEAEDPRGAGDRVRQLLIAALALTPGAVEVRAEAVQHEHQRGERDLPADLLDRRARRGSC